MVVGPRDVDGQAMLRQKVSAVDGNGNLRVEAIHGLRVRLTRPVPHDDGHLVEIARASWAVVDEPIVQVHMSTTFPGRIRAWGLHQRTSDRLFVVSGMVRVVCYDARIDSPTRGRIAEITLSERNPGLVVVPPNVYHGWQNIGESESVVINMPTHMYDYDAPDALNLPWDSAVARDLIPYTW